MIKTFLSAGPSQAIFAEPAGLKLHIPPATTLRQPGGMKRVLG